MRMALEEAEEEAARRGEVPVGAVIVSNGRVIGRGHNLTETLTDVTAHAEMMAITAAAASLGGKYLPGCTLYASRWSPAPCAPARSGWSQIGRIVYGTSDPETGFFSYFNPARSPIHPKTTVEGGLLEEECRQLMTDFFKSLENEGRQRLASGLKPFWTDLCLPPHRNCCTKIIWKPYMRLYGFNFCHIVFFFITFERKSTPSNLNYNRKQRFPFNF